MPEDNERQPDEAPEESAGDRPDPSNSSEFGVKSDDRDSDAGQAEVQEKFDKIEEKGYIGVVPDPTPNEHYSLETDPDAPTPETDPELAKKVGDHGRFSEGRVVLRDGSPVVGSSDED